MLIWAVSLCMVDKWYKAASFTKDACPYPFGHNLHLYPIWLTAKVYHWETMIFIAPPLLPGRVDVLVLTQPFTCWESQTNCYGSGLILDIFWNYDQWGFKPSLPGVAKVCFDKCTLSESDNEVTLRSGVMQKYLSKVL